MPKALYRFGFLLLATLSLAMTFLAQCQHRVTTPTSTPEVGKEYHPPGTKGGPMVYVPAGEFTMGLSADAALQECQKYHNDCKRGEWFANGEPSHRVYLDAYYLDKYEVTQGDYDQCVSAGKCRDNWTIQALGKNDDFKGTSQPVVGVEWNDARSYCEWAGKRLPTEAQWEKAARGTDGRMYPWGNQKASCELANSADCKLGKTWPVGTKPAGASPYGALDMAGNVWEWVADWYGDDYYSSSPKKNPTGPSSGTCRVLRGGSWRNNPHVLHASNRSRDEPDYMSFSWGFRCSGD